MTDTGTHGTALMRLYEAISKARADQEPTVRQRPVDDRREYMREAKRASRERAMAAAEAGRLEDRAATVRDVLADAALILLATGAPGSAEIERLLGIAFQARPGTPGKIRARARTGAIRPKILTPDMLRSRVPCTPPCVAK